MSVAVIATVVGIGVVALIAPVLGYWVSGPDPDPAWLYPLPPYVDVKSTSSGCDTASTECGYTIHVSGREKSDAEVIDALAAEYEARGWSVESSGLSTSSNSPESDWYSMVRPREPKLFFWTEQPTLYISAEAIGSGVVVDFDQTRAPRDQAQ